MKGELYLQALTHSTWAQERGGPHNERLEFIGDAVLQLAASELLFHAFPEASEGEMSRMRKQVVNNTFLARQARQIGIGPSLLLGRGEDRTGGRERERNLAGAYEALLGALYLEQGLEAVSAVVATLILPQMAELPGRRNDKQILHEWAQATYKVVPRYEVLAEEGPAHQRRFSLAVRVLDEVLGEGEGSSKPRASQAAASAALRRLRERGQL